MPHPLRVLLIEDSDDDAMLLLRELRQGGYDPVHERVDTASAVTAALDRCAWDLVISDYHMPGFNGRDALRLVRQRGLEIPFIFVSGTIGEDIAVEAMKAGANDYVMKGKLKRLNPAIERELRDAATRKSRLEAEQALAASQAALRRSEDDLRQAQKMEAIGRLAGGVAHDFNNVLTVILSCCDFLGQDLDAGDPRRDDVFEIRKAAEGASSLTRQLLAFSRRQVLRLHDLQLNTVVTTVGRLLQRLIGDEVVLHTVLAPDAGWVHADVGQLEQAIINLVVNARDAMPAGGTITVETAAADLREPEHPQGGGRPPGAYVRLTVRDTGSGMDASTKAHALEPFFTTKPPGKGTGLGLAMVYGIVKQSNGGLEIDSAPGQGTAVHLYLPRVAQPSTPHETGIARPTVTRGDETILLVDDSVAIRSVARRALTRMGYTVLEAQDGPAALRMADEHTGRIHLLLTDVAMPSMNGGELGGELIRRRPGIRVLYASGYIAEAPAQHGMTDATVALIAKPFTLNELVRRVRELLDR